MLLVVGFQYRSRRIARKELDTFAMTRGKILVERPRGRGVTSLPDELLCSMTGFLDVPSLLQMRAVNRRFRELTSRNEAGWTNHCTRLWKDKIHVSPAAREHEHAMIAYRISSEDAEKRDSIAIEELCYDVSQQTGSIWSFRFKSSAGSDWTSWDPWWCGRKARQMVFLPDGTVKQYLTSDTGDAHLTSPTFGRGVLVDPPVAMTWRFLTRPLDLPSRPEGSYIRFSVGGRDVPTYVVRRSPTGNWGFLMESCWGVYASFELPPRRGAESRLRLRRTPIGSRWLPPDSDTEEEESEDKDYLLIDDSALIITNEVQWREALLYNFGARVLPEGDGAAEEFDRTWGATIHARG